MFLEYLNEQTIPALCGLIYCVLLYLDTSLNNTIRRAKDYIKGFIIIYALSYLSIYLYEMRSNISIGNNVDNVTNSLREEIFVGVPNF
jgi:hypothetical protein